MTAVTFADRDNGPKYLEGYASDTVRVSGVLRRFRVTSKKLYIPETEVEFIADYMKQTLHGLAHPAVASIRRTINPTSGGGVSIGNYFHRDRERDFVSTAANIVNIGQRIRYILASAVPTAYLYFNE